MKVGIHSNHVRLTSRVTTVDHGHTLHARLYSRLARRSGTSVLSRDADASEEGFRGEQQMCRGMVLNF